MFFGDLNDPESLVSKLLRAHQSMRMQVALKTEPRVYYLVADTEAADSLKACLACHR
jgi:Fe-S-cluster-containing dehydrogenase component